MSQENVERLRTAFENFLAGRSNFGADLLAPDVEWDASELEILDVSGIHHGQRRFASSGESGWALGRRCSSSTS